MIQTIGIIGLGSIGRRHARIIHTFFKDVDLYAYRTKKGALGEAPTYIQEIGEKEFYKKRFDLAIISNPSSLHFPTLKKIITNHAANSVFVEKPFCLPNEVDECKSLIRKEDVAVYPGNSLRFHPAVQILKNIMREGRLGEAVECIAHAGSSMPGWHPYEDYRTSYASQKKMGGGVLLTSIHEIDLVCHLFGHSELFASYINNVVLNDIDVEDVAHLLIKSKKCSISNVSLNFFQQPYRRYLEVAFEYGSFLWNFDNDYVTVADAHDGKKQQTPIDAEVDTMYNAMWEEIFSGSSRQNLFELASVFNSLELISSAIHHSHDHKF